MYSLGSVIHTEICLAPQLELELYSSRRGNELVGVIHFPYYWGRFWRSYIYATYSSNGSPRYCEYGSADFNQLRRYCPGACGYIDTEYMDAEYMDAEYVDAPEKELLWVAAKVDLSEILDDLIQNLHSDKRYLHLDIERLGDRIKQITLYGWQGKRWEIDLEKRKTIYYGKPGDVALIIEAAISVVFGFDHEPQNLPQKLYRHVDHIVPKLRSAVMKLLLLMMPNPDV